jgi:transposase-like protein
VKIHRYTFIKKRIITTDLDDFTGEAPSSPKDVNLPDVSISPKGEMDLLFYKDPLCPLCLSSNVSKNGTFVRTLESGQPILIQKYICNDCGHSFDARPPNYGYGNHFSNETKEKSVKGRVKTSLRNVKSFFLDLLDMSISHETVRKNVPTVSKEKW